MIRITFIICLATWCLVAPAQAQQLTKEQLQHVADDLLISTKYTAEIQQVLPIVDDLQVIVLVPHYREHPSIILLKKDKNTNTWKRTFECLSPGIEVNPLGLFDWHTTPTNTGIDFVPNNIKVNSFTDKTIVNLIETSFTVKGGVLIPYQNFVHMNTADEQSQKEFTPYTIDKTQYFDFANQLANKKHSKTDASNCMIFDTPLVQSCSLKKVEGKYQIVATTQNNQTWTYTFDGIDPNCKYLVNKKITVTKN